MRIQNADRLIFLLILIICLFSVGCTTGKKSGLRLKSYGYVKLNDRELSKSEFSELKAAFKKLESTVYSLNIKPDLILYCYDDIDDKGADMFCIFMKDELIYEGDYFYAWADEMKGLKSNCYRLNEDTYYLLQSLSGK